MVQQLPPQVLALIAERFRVLAEPARLRILNTLMVRERTVTELVEVTELNQANVSKHLSMLRAAGFVSRRKEGLFAYYSIADHTVAELCEIMCGRLELQLEQQAAVLDSRL